MRQTVFEKSQEGQHAYSLPKDDHAFQEFQPEEALLRKIPPPLPELSEIDLTRHFNALADENVGIEAAL
jgi:glycine dehydrogenase subunit 2